MFEMFGRIIFVYDVRIGTVNINYKNDFFLQFPLYSLLENVEILKDCENKLSSSCIIILFFQEDLLLHDCLLNT